MHARTSTIALTALALTAISAAPRAQCVEWTATFLFQGLNGQVFAMQSFTDQAGDALYVAGGFTSAGGVPGTQRIARWNGSSWSALAGGTDGDVDALAVFDDGTGSALYAAGEFTTAGGVPAQRVARWDGASWSAAGAFDGTVRALLVFDDGSGAALYAGGIFSGGVARWDGTSWVNIGGTLTGGAVLTMTGFDHELYVGGSFASIGGVSASRVARWDGAAWSAVDGGMNDVVLALAAYDDGSGRKLYAGGLFTSAGDPPLGVFRMARLEGAKWEQLAAGAGGAVRTLVAFDDGAGLDLYAGGDFAVIGSHQANKIARWDGERWWPLASGIQGASPSVQELAVFDDGFDGDADLYVGGNITSAGGISSQNIAKWNGCGALGEPFCLGDGTLLQSCACFCPCMNAGDAGRGCDNFAETGGAVLSATGSVDNDTVVLTSNGERVDAFSIFLQGSTTIAPVDFGDGIRCIGGALTRLYAKNASLGTAFAPDTGAGEPSIMTVSAAQGDPIAPGTTRYYQVYYRDPTLSFCPSPTGSSFNVSGALRIDW